jgi:hypothetical protein
MQFSSKILSIANNEEIREFYLTTSRIVVIGVEEIKAILSLDLWLFLVIFSYSDNLNRILLASPW